MGCQIGNKWFRGSEISRCIRAAQFMRGRTTSLYHPLRRIETVTAFIILARHARSLWQLVVAPSHFTNAFISGAHGRLTETVDVK